MKLVKLASVVAIAAAIAACGQAEKKAAEASNATVPAAETQQTAVKAENSERVVVYRCEQDKTVIATYDFVGNDAKAAILTVNDQPVKDLVRDESNKDFTSFTSKDYTWNVDAGLNITNYDKVPGSILFQKTKESDVIVAKDCSTIDAKETERLNVNNK